MAAETSRSSTSADSYIGSLISLTSKCEIRYEGVLYNINTEESSIGLRNVRSFGTEGRKKDGPQIPPSDKIYEYILFRGTDIKDLQVKSSPPVHSNSSVHNDPAIIQSHYSRPPSVSSSLPSTVSASTPDIDHAAQGFPRSTLQSGLPFYQQGGTVGSWGSAAVPPNANGSALVMPPMYWPGFYGPTSGLPPHLQQQQQPLLRPPPGLPFPPSLQQPVQYSALNTASLLNSSPNLREHPSSLLPPLSLPGTGVPNLNLISSNLPPTVSSIQATTLSSDSLPTLIPNKGPDASFSSSPPLSNLPLVSPHSSGLEVGPVAPSTSSKSRTGPGLSLQSQTATQLISVMGASASSKSDSLVVPTLVTPDLLMHSGPQPQSSSKPLCAESTIVETARSGNSEPPSSSASDTQAALLPLPPLANHKMNGGLLSRRGRERGRGNGMLQASRATTRFTEDFDFIAMNEKFNKSEVWGHLGKSKAVKEDKISDDDNNDLEDGDTLDVKIKPVYVKDDFFDSLSCNSLDRGSGNGRTKFSEQMKIDTETFGDFARNRGRGGRLAGRGWRGRGFYSGRGYGYIGRSHGRAPPARTM